MRALLLLALLAPAVVSACMLGQLVSDRLVEGGIICTYALSDGTQMSVLYPRRLRCPNCLE